MRHRVVVGREGFGLPVLGVGAGCVAQVIETDALLRVQGGALVRIVEPGKRTDGSQRVAVAAQVDEDRDALELRPRALGVGLQDVVEDDERILEARVLGRQRRFPFAQVGRVGEPCEPVGERGSQAVLVIRIVARLETIEDLVEAVAHDTSPSRVPAMVTASSLVARPRAARGLADGDRVGDGDVVADDVRRRCSGVAMEPERAGIEGDVEAVAGDACRRQVEHGAPAGGQRVGIGGGQVDGGDRPRDARAPASWPVRSRPAPGLRRRRIVERQDRAADVGGVEVRVRGCRPGRPARRRARRARPRAPDRRRGGPTAA